AGRLSLAHAARAVHARQLELGDARPCRTVSTRQVTSAGMEEENTSQIGRFIMKYPTFLSSLVVGIAGLVATSIWQFRQSANQKAQADAAQKVAETQAANSWKI